MKQWIGIALAVLLPGWATARAGDADLQAQVAALQQRIAQLEAQQSEQAVSQRNAELVGQMVRDLAQQSHGPAADTSVTAGYDKRFFIKSTDDQFKLELDTLLQFRHTYAYANDGDRRVTKYGTAWQYDDDWNPVDRARDLGTSASAFELERARVALLGHVLKDLNYRIVLEGDDDSRKGEYLYEYELNYSFMPELGVRLGKYKAPFGKGEMVSNARQMLVDGSLANEVFNLDRATGVELFGTLNLGDVKPEYRAMMFNKFRGDNDAPFAQNDNSPSVAARLVTPLLGATSADFENESDLEFHENPVWQLGGSFAYANDRNENHFAGGESSAYPFLGKSGVDGQADVYRLGGEATMLGADVACKYLGLSVILEGFYQHLNPDDCLTGADDFTGFGTNRSLGVLQGDSLDNYGWYAQAGYFVVPSTLELAARVGGVCVDNATDSYEYTGGWNWYLNKSQDLKLSMDLTYIDRLPIVSSSANYDGVQNQGLFLVRTQLQFQF